MRKRLSVLAVFLLACGDTTTAPVALGGEARLRVVHTVPGVPAVDVLVGGKLAIANLGYGDLSPVVAVPAGTHEVGFRAAGSSGTAQGLPVAFAAGDTTLILTVDSASILNPWVLTDSNTVVPAGRSKVRAVHFAAGTPGILAWRTQPDFNQWTTFQFPFPYRHATPYLESDAGDWQVLVSLATYSAGVPVQADTLAMSDAFTVPSGESRTVLILDGVNGGIVLRVIGP